MLPIMIERLRPVPGAQDPRTQKDGVGDEQRAVAPDLDPDRPAIIFLTDPETGEHVDRHARRLRARERNEHHLGAARRAAVP